MPQLHCYIYVSSLFLHIKFYKKVKRSFEKINESEHPACDLCVSPVPLSNNGSTVDSDSPIPPVDPVAAQLTGGGTLEASAVKRKPLRLRGGEQVMASNFWSFSPEHCVGEIMALVC